MYNVRVKILPFKHEWARLTGFILYCHCIYSFNSMKEYSRSKVNEGTSRAHDRPSMF